LHDQLHGCDLQCSAFSTAITVNHYAPLLISGLFGFVDIMMLLPTFEDYTLGLGFKCALASSLVELAIFIIVIIIFCCKRGEESDSDVGIVQFFSVYHLSITIFGYEDDD